MELLRLTALVIYTLGTFAYGAVVWLWLRQCGRIDLTRLPPRPERNRPLEWVGGALLLVSFAWFAANVVAELSGLHEALRGVPRDAPLMVVFLFPPLVMHTVYLEGGGAAVLPSWFAWRFPLLGMYAVCLPLALWVVLALLDAAPFPLPGGALSMLIAASFIGVAVYCLLAMRQGRRGLRGAARPSSPWIRRLFWAVLVVFVLVIVGDLGLVPFVGLLDVGSRSMPLMFLFASTYAGNRYAFYDRFVKRGLALIATIAILTLYFALLLPWLDGFTLGWSRPLVFALDVLPVVAALPWLYASLGRRLDRFWFGRQFPPGEALTHFLASCYPGATTEADLVARAEAALGTIFDTTARIELDPLGARRTTTADAPVVPIGPVTGPVGVLQLQPRPNQRPFFSQDIALLRPLVDVFWYLLENMRLQQKKREQETLATELSLKAARSHLTALRAQINPHFLFNALNAIAGLIPKDSRRADAAIEQLSEVFRYTLRGSDREWARLDEEVDFVRAYLEVEQARFGPRLEVTVATDDEARRAIVPTMMIHTLVENAIKHGIAPVRGGGRIGVSATVTGDRLRIEVTDTGAGFEATAPAVGQEGGFGLQNVRDRLQGYFGDRAAVTVARDPERALTVVAFEIPHVVDAPPVTLTATQDPMGEVAR